MRNKNARVPDPNKFVSPHGDDFHIEYTAEIQKDGTIKLVECGKMNIKEYINSFKESTDMEYILKCMALGDDSVLTHKQPIFGDFTEAPTSLMEFQQRMIDGQRAFMSLPVDVRNEYDHDLMKFMADVGSEKWMNAMKDMLPKENKVDSEVTENA